MQQWVEVKPGDVLGNERVLLAPAANYEASLYHCHRHCCLGELVGKLDKISRPQKPCCAISVHFKGVEKIGETATETLFQCSPPLSNVTGFFLEEVVERVNEDF